MQHRTCAPRRPLDVLLEAFRTAWLDWRREHPNDEGADPWGEADSAECDRILDRLLPDGRAAVAQLATDDRLWERELGSAETTVADTIRQAVREACWDVWSSIDDGGAR